MLSSILAALTSFGGNYLLVPLYGAAGAAVATAVAFWVFYSAELSFRVRCGVRYLGLSFIWLPLSAL